MNRIDGYLLNKIAVILYETYYIDKEQFKKSKVSKELNELYEKNAKKIKEETKHE